MIHPLVLLGSYVFIFGICLGTKPGPDEVTQNYPMLLFAGMLPWMLFSETLLRSSSSIVEHANLITKTIFPAEIVPVTIFLSSLISHLLAVALFIAVAGLWMRDFSPMIFLLPVFLLLLGLLAVGLGWIAGALQVYLRDTAQILTVIMTLWFWVTPILITEKQFPVWARFAIRANPLAYLVRAYRVMLLGHRLPSGQDMAATAAFAVGAFVVGGLFFRYLKRGFADVL